jgi:hypothetical protein
MVRYVRLYARHLLVDSVAAQWAAFKRGFDLVCGDGTSSVTGSVTGKRAMRLFVWQELELLICGSPQLDFAGTRAARACVPCVDACTSP